MIEVKITLDRMLELAKLADWQLVELGYDPKSITEAYLKYMD